MNKKKYPKHLSLRDIEVVIFIAEAGAISLSTLSKVLEQKFKTPLEARGLRALASSFDYWGYWIRKNHFNFKYGQGGIRSELESGLCRSQRRCT